MFRLYTTFIHLYFHFCCELALDSWGTASSTCPLQVHELDHTHSLASVQYSGPQRALLQTESFLNVRNGAPTRRKECFLGPFVQESRTVAHLALTWAFLQPVATDAMHCHPPGDTHPPALIPLFLLTQNLSSKRIVPTDNMWPNFNDDYSHHQ